MGAWLAARIVTGDLVADRLIPEGFDDFHLEKQDPVHIEVKSRQLRLGPFPVNKAVEHLITAWIRHKNRFGTNRKLIVVLEQGIKGVSLHSPTPILERSPTLLFEQIDDFKVKLIAQLDKHKRHPNEIDELVSATSVVLCTWSDLDAETGEYINQVVDLPPAGLPRLTNELRGKVVDAVNHNAEATYSSRTGLDRTSLVLAIRNTASLFDTKSLEYAITTGICTLVDKQPTNIGDAFYEGVATQPGHVSAGLVVPRPDLLQQAVEGFEFQRPVLFTGPSGVGKSAVLWMLPHAFPGILWFRVNRATQNDIQHIIRLLEAFGVSPKSPVGLLVDAAGRDGLGAWELLHQAAMAMPGALLIGAARNEDLFTLGNLADCHIVKVTLDSKSAAAIHTGLVRRKVTAVRHWREALEISKGLTLEFTHLLTKGSRLQTVLKNQVNERIRQHRKLELNILALVVTADSWHGSIEVTELEQHLQADPLELRAALERLIEEHLLINHNGTLSGTHQIRSRELVDVIHKKPPPMLVASVISVIGLLPAASLDQFIFGFLRDFPELEQQIVDALQENAFKSATHLLAILWGLDLLDFHRKASAWIETLQRMKVPTAHQPQAMFYAIAKLDPAIFPKDFQNAVNSIAHLPIPSTSREYFVHSVGIAKIAAVISNMTSPQLTHRLLRSLGKLSIDWEPLFAAINANNLLTAYLNSCSVSDLGDVIAAARSINSEFAAACIRSVGGVDNVLQRVRVEDPWIQTLSVTICEDEKIVTSRFLHVSDSLQPEPDKKAVGLGRQLLSALPDIDRVDIKSVKPNGFPLGIGNYEYGSSGLLREHNVHPSDEVDWNRNRSRLAQTLIGVSETERLSTMIELLPEIAKLIQDFG